MFCGMTGIETTLCCRKTTVHAQRKPSLPDHFWETHKSRVFRSQMFHRNLDSAAKSSVRNLPTRQSPQATIRNSNAMCRIKIFAIPRAHRERNNSRRCFWFNGAVVKLLAGGAFLSTGCSSAPRFQSHTLTNPISAAFSRKHWRQMLRPYFLIKPALCVQTRLFVPKISCGSPCKFPNLSSFCAQLGRNRWRGLPGTGTFAVCAGTRVPDGFVRHGRGLRCRVGEVGREIVVIVKLGVVGDTFGDFLWETLIFKQFARMANRLPSPHLCWSRLRI